MRPIDHECTQAERLARMEQESAANTKILLKLADGQDEIFRRLFKDNGVTSIQTSLLNGSKRMEDHERQIKELKKSIYLHEQRPRKILGLIAVVTPIVLAVGGAVYKVACWIIDNFQWSHTP